MLRAAFPDVPGASVPEAGRGKLLNLADQLPAIFDLIVLEHRMVTTDAQVDLLLGSIRGRRAPGLFTEPLASLDLHPRGRKFLTTWLCPAGILSRSAAMWLEFDVPVEGGARLGMGTAVTPTLFEPLGETVSVADQLELVRAGCLAITGEDIDQVTACHLENVVGKLPCGWPLTYVAPLDIRGSSELRLVCVMPVAAMESFLSGLGWPGSTIANVVGVAGRERALAGLQFNVGPGGIGRHLAIERYFKGAADQEAANAALDRYERSRIAAPGRGTGLRHWLSPVELMLEGLPVVMDRSLVLKTTCAADRLQAKAYLEFSFRPRL